MESPRSVEELRRIDLNLEDLISKFQSRVQLIREDLQSLIKDLDSLKNHIDERRRFSNDYTREISDLTNDHQALTNELTGIEKEIASHEENLDSLNNTLIQTQERLNADKNQLVTLESEQSSLSAILKRDEEEFTALKTKYDQLRPEFNKKLGEIEHSCIRLKDEKEMLTFRFQAIRILSQSYLQTPEVNLIRFLANKPSNTSTLTEIRSSLGIDPSSLNVILEKLASYNVLEFDQVLGKVVIQEKIDLFSEEG